MAELVDTHCHIQSAGNYTGERPTSEVWAKDPEITADALVKEALEENVTKMVCVGCDLPDSLLAVDFVQTQEHCWASIGIHPHEAQHYAGEQSKLNDFADLADNPKVVAIGECGLDFFYTHSPKEAQLEVLAFQLELAQSKNLPLIFHVREAFDDFWLVFEQYAGVRGVLHSFTDSAGNMEKAVEHGLYIGVNGIATFAKQDSQLAMYRSIPLENLVLETDAPFLTPTPYRGKINKPKFVSRVAEFVAELRDENLDEVAQATSLNAAKLFGI